MSLITWAVLYLADLAFWLRVVLWGGAELLEGTFASGCLVSFFAPRWSATGIKIFGWCSLAGSSVWFVVGAFCPELRF